MSDFLQSMAAASRQRAQNLPARLPQADLERPSYPLSLAGFDVIAEIKDRSPAEGELARPDADRARRARQYTVAGAAAISVLTEPSRFGGAMSHLREVVDAVSERHLPVMRKDFLVDRRQVLEAKAAGASGVLLIAALLDDRQLTGMLECALDHSLFVLLESFDAQDLERSGKLLRRSRFREAAADARLLVGVNSRNLRTLEVDAARLAQLAARLPEGHERLELEEHPTPEPGPGEVRIAVAESGISRAEDVAAAAADGYRMALIGTALMRSDDPAALVAALLDAGRRRVAA